MKFPKPNPDGPVGVSGKFGLGFGCPSIPDEVQSTTEVAKNKIKNGIDLPLRG